MGKLLLLFIVVPAIELILLIQLGGVIGTMPTIGVIVVTGVLGASLARWQGLVVLRRIQGDLAAGRLPAGAMIDGVIILLAGALLMTPGFLTDIVGFACLVPGIRGLIKNTIRVRLERAIRDGGSTIFVQFGPGREPPGGRSG